MEIILMFVLFSAGILLIIKGGDFFIDAAGWMSDVTGISKAVIGATLVSLATTSPEYFVSLIATLKGLNDLSIGNAAGSLIANLGIAFALLAFLAPARIHDRFYGIKGGVMIAAAALLWLFCLSGALSVAEALVLLLLFVLFTLFNIRYSKDGEAHRPRTPTNPRDISTNVLKFVGGAAGVILGSNLIVDNAQRIAALFGISEAVIGLTVVAVGTSLPEIVTSVAAIVKKQNALSIGNIVGANILDATLILATGAFVSGGRLSVSASTVRVDLPVALLLMLIAVLPTAIGKKIYRWQGALLLGLYALYLVYITLLAG